MTDDRNSAEWLADRAGLGPSPEREVWVRACVEIVLAARVDAREEGRQEERQRFVAVIRELAAFHHVSRWVAPWLAARVSESHDSETRGTDSKTAD